jgi:glycerol-3-phosphate dehydrogenase
MKRDVAALGKKHYDVIVVGGGIYGVCAVWEAASRGLSSALVEMGDFAHATSANSYKIVHGGMRYLQHADIYRVRESSRERSALLCIAPHLVKPVPIVMPTYGHGRMGKFVLRLGFFVYDLLTCDRNRGIRDPDRRIPRARTLSVGEVTELFPGVARDGLTGGVLFYDGQMYNAPRLALSFLRSAVDAGADVANYCQVTGFLRDAGRVVGIDARDVLSGERIQIRGRIVINTAGPWAARLTVEDLGISPGRKVGFSRDVGLVVPRRLPNEYGLACPTATKDADALLDRGARHLFLMPWRDYTMLGVWHGVYSGTPDEFSVTPDELAGFVEQANAIYPDLRLTADDILTVISGLILFGDEDQAETEHRFAKRSLLIDHARDDGLQGILTLLGVRATTARGMAEKAIDLAFRKLGRRGPRSRTAVTPIHGGAMRSVRDCIAAARRDGPAELSYSALTALVHNYGCEYSRVLKYSRDEPILAEMIGDSTVLKGEVVHAAREEMAQTLQDVVFRRTDLGSAGDPGSENLRICAELMAKELGWDEERLSRELDSASEELAQRSSVKKYVRATAQLQH